MEKAVARGHDRRWRVCLIAVAIGATIAASQGARAEGELRSMDGINLSLKLSDAIFPAAGIPASPASPAGRSSSGTRDYRIGTEDLLEIQVFGIDQLSRTVRVNSMGYISLPLIGNVEVGGLTAQESESTIASRLSEAYLQNPQVSVFIKEFTNQRVTVEGAVNKPGIYPLRGQTTLLRTLAMAGGQGSLSDMKEVMLFRAGSGGKREAQVFDVESIRRGEADDPMVVNDDLIVVNRDRARTVMKDSILRDVLDAINPFSPLVPH